MPLLYHTFDKLCTLPALIVSGGIICEVELNSAQ